MCKKLFHLLSLQNAVDELYTFMKQFVESAEADVLWRLARATCDKAKSTADKALRKELMYDAFRAAELALKLGDTNFACHKVLNCYTHLVASFQDNLGKLYLKAEPFWILVKQLASAGPYANHLHLSPDR